MITEVQFENFKALRNVSLSLGQFVVLVGPNCSGKTSVLEALDCLSQYRSREPEEIFSGARDFQKIRSKGANAPPRLTALVTGDGRQVRLSILAPSAHSQMPLARASDRPSEAAFLPTPIMLHLDPRQIAEPSYSEQLHPALASDGSGLASVLADIATGDADAFASLVKAAGAVIPALQRIRVPRAEVVRQELEPYPSQATELLRLRDRIYWGHELVLDLLGADAVPASAASEGTLIVLALLTQLRATEGSAIVLLDDLERGLHPRALGSLVAQLRSFLGNHPDVQIVATAHSPYLLDHLTVDEVRLTTLDDEGSVVAGTLSEHPDFDRWKDAMTPGEMWSILGEDWLKERRSSGRTE